MLGSKLTRKAFSLIEVLIATAILALLIGLLLAAVQRVRLAAAGTKCLNNLRQIGIATQNQIGVSGHFPSGNSYLLGKSPTLHRSWLALLLPYMERDGEFEQSEEAFNVQPDFRLPPHPCNIIQPIFNCPLDPRSNSLDVFAITAGGDIKATVGFTAYLGNQGIDSFRLGGVLFADSQIKPGDVTDGLSNTLLAGERPPSYDTRFGWWYGGTGIDGIGTFDTSIGSRERSGYIEFSKPCGYGPYHFKQRKLDECSAVSYWSFHPGGANFAFCDGSVKFMRYEVDSILPALSTRAGGEVVENY